MVRGKLVLREALLAFIVALVAAFSWPLAPVTFTQAFDISITTLGDANPEAKGHEVWISHTPADIPVAALVASSNPPGGWVVRNEQAFSVTQNATVRWSGKAAIDGKLVFASHAWCGKASVTINGTTRVLDLYSAKVLTQTIALAEFRGERGLGFYPPFFAMLGGWTLALLLLFRGLALVGRFVPEGPPSSSRAIVGYALPTLAICLTALMGEWPGAMSPDSIDQWAQVIRGQFSNHHPVMHTILFGGPAALLGSPGWAIVIQIVAFAASIGFMCLEMTRWRINPAIVWLTAIATPAFPAVHLMSIVYWKDIPYSIALLFISAGLLQLARTKGQILHDPLFIWWMAVALLAQAMFRHNGLLVSMGLVALIALFCLPRRPWPALGVWAMAGFIFPAAFSLVLVPALGIQPMSKTAQGLVPLHVLAAMEANNRIKDPQLEAKMSAILSKKEWDDSYDCQNSMGRLMHPNADVNSVDGSFTTPALMLMLANPDVAVSHVVCVNSIGWRLSPAGIDGPIPVGIWPPANAADSPGLYPISQPVLGDVHKLVMQENAWTQNSELKMVIFWRPALFSLLTVALGLLTVLHGRSWAMLLALTPILLNTASMIPVIQAQDYRYQFPATLIGFMLILAYVGIHLRGFRNDPASGDP